MPELGNHEDQPPTKQVPIISVNDDDDFMTECVRLSLGNCHQHAHHLAKGRGLQPPAEEFPLNRFSSQLQHHHRPHSEQHHLQPQLEQHHQPQSQHTTTTRTTN